MAVWKAKEVKEIARLTPTIIKGMSIDEFIYKMPVGFYCNVSGVCDNVWVILFNKELVKVVVRFGRII